MKNGFDKSAKTIHPCRLAKADTVQNILGLMNFVHVKGELYCRF